MSLAAPPAPGRHVPPEQEPLALIVRSVSHQFGSERVLHEVDLLVEAAQVHCLLGASGSGKSTLLRLIAGLEELQTGSITIAGRVVSNAVAGRGPSHVPPENRAVGFVFQDYALFPHVNVLRNVLFGMAKPARHQTDDRLDRAIDLLARVDMTAFAQAMPHTLSGGQQQRVALARALARRPEVMLLDEPFSGLDGKLRAEVREQTIEVLSAARVATLIVTHDPQEALLLGDRVSVINDGRLLQTGSPQKLTRGPASIRVAEVFGPVNAFDCRVDQGGVMLPWGRVPVTGYSDGDRVTVAVRAEDVVLEPAAEAADVAITRVVQVRPLYGACEIWVEVLGSMGCVVRVIDLARAGWAVGDAVRVSAPDHAIVVHHPE